MPANRAIAWIRRHAFGVVVGALGAAALTSGALSILRTGDVPISGQLIVAAVVLGIAVFACVAVAGFLGAYRQIRRQGRASSLEGKPS